MTWFKVDDAFPSHPKVRAIPKAQRPGALGLWLACGTESARWLTDGAVGIALVREHGGLRLAAALSQVRLWHEPGETCTHPPDECPCSPGEHFQFHDWGDWQPTRAQVQTRNQAKREAGAKGGVVSGRVRRLRAIGDDP